MDEREFATLMLRLADATNKELTDSLTDLWVKRFLPEPENILRLGFNLAVETCHYWPSVVEFTVILRKSSRAFNDGLPTAEQKTAVLLRKLQRYNPDIGVVNDGSRGAIIGGQSGREEDQGNSGFTSAERYVLRLFGGARLCAGWSATDVHFNREKLTEAFTRLEDDAVQLHHLLGTDGYSVDELRLEAERRRRRQLGAGGDDA